MGISIYGSGVGGSGPGWRYPFGLDTVTGGEGEAREEKGFEN